jgi:hypothetical protein
VFSEIKISDLVEKREKISSKHEIRKLFFREKEGKISKECRDSFIERKE